MAFFNPGDVEVNSISISGAKGTVDLTNQMQILSIFEDIQVPGVNCELVVLEDKALISILPLVGEETLTVNFNTPSLGAADYEFAVASMSDANPTENLKTKSYKIQAVAKEVLSHKKTLIQKSYRTNNHSIVQDIFNNFLGSSKSLYTEATKGIQEYIVTNKKPFIAINDIRKRSASEQNKSASYVFYENQAGYFFRTLEDLFSQGTVATFTNDAVTADSIFRVIFRNILGYNLPDQFNTPDKIGKGAFNQRMKSIDMKTLEYKDVERKPDVDGMKRADSGGMSSGSFKAQHGSSAGTSSFVPMDSTKPPSFIDDFLPDQKAYIAEIDQSKLTMRVFGDSTLKAGDMVAVNILENLGTTENIETARLIAGNYMISKLRHVIGPADVKPRYTMVLELIKGSYKEGI